MKQDGVTGQENSLPSELTHVTGELLLLSFLLHVGVSTEWFLLPHSMRNPTHWTGSKSNCLKEKKNKKKTLTLDNILCLTLGCHIASLPPESRTCSDSDQETETTLPSLWEERQSHILIACGMGAVVATFGKYNIPHQARIPYPDKLFIN